MLTKTNARLIEYAERIDRIQNEIEGLKEDVAAIYGEAKSDGFSPSALRKAIKIHAMDASKREKHDAEQTDLEIYLAQLEGREIGA